MRAPFDLTLELPGQTMGDDNDATEGQPGTDELRFTLGRQRVDPAVAQWPARTPRPQVASVVMHLNALEQIDVSALGGDDRITVDEPHRHRRHPVGGADILSARRWHAARRGRDPHHLRAWRGVPGGDP